MKKILIFGIGGFVGSYLGKEFFDSGYQVYGTDKVGGDNLPDFVEFHQSDLLDGPAVEKLVNEIKPDAIVNLAAISSVGASWNIPELTMQVNVGGAINILEAVRKASPTTKVMFVGSSEEYESSDNPLSEDSPLNANNPYGVSKIAQEHFARIYRQHFGLKIYCVRSFNHTGIGQKDAFVLPSFCKQVAEIDKSGKPGVIRVGNLTVERDFSDVRDIVRAYKMILDSDDDSVIYNVGSGKALKLSALLDYIISFSHQPIKVEIDQSRIRPSDTPRICCDNTRLKTKLGWEPEYSIFIALKDLFDYYRNL